MTVGCKITVMHTHCQDVLDFDSWFQPYRDASITKGIRSVNCMNFTMRSELWWNEKHPDDRLDGEKYHFSYKLSM